VDPALWSAARGKCVCCRPDEIRAGIRRPIPNLGADAVLHVATTPVLDHPGLHCRCQHKTREALEIKFHFEHDRRVAFASHGALHGRHGCSLRHRPGYYVVHTDTYKALPQAAHLFYGGSLYYLVAGSAYILVFASSLFEYIDRAEGRKAEGPNYLSRGHWVVVAPLITAWLASWLFWSGFVQLAGDRYEERESAHYSSANRKCINSYCSPNLIHQGIVWVCFSLFGIALGTGY